MTDMWLWTCESCGAKTATECDKFDAADVRCAMCGSALVGDEQKGMAVVQANRLAALERLYQTAIDGSYEELDEAIDHIAALIAALEAGADGR